MGCGGSKEGVVTGSTTVIHRRLLQRKSQPSVAQTTFTDTPNSTITNPFDGNFSKSTSIEEAAIDTKIEETPVLATVVETADAPNADEEAKLITEESPEEYFSSRKDAEAVSEVVVGAEYYSPERVTDKEGGKKEKSNVLEGRELKVIDNGEALDEGKDLVGGEEAIEPKEADEKLSSQDSVDFKETILVEETRVESNIEQTSIVGEGDLTGSK